MPHDSRSFRVSAKEISVWPQNAFRKDLKGFHRRPAFYFTAGQKIDFAESENGSAAISAVTYGDLIARLRSFSGVTQKPGRDSCAA
jgi:hypothetical protein